MTGEMWTVCIQLKGKSEDDECIDFDVDRVHLTFHNLIGFKEQLGYGARDFLYYKKRCGGDVATIEPIEYLRDAETMLCDNAMEKEIRLIMSKEPEGQGNVIITPLKQPVGKRRHADTGTDEQLDAYKVWLLKLQEEDPEIDSKDDFRDETIDTYKEWLRHTGRRRHMLSLLQEHSDTDNDQLNGGEGSQQDRRTANNNNRPAHARKPKEGNGASKTRTRGCLKGFKAATKRIQSGTQKLKIEFDSLTEGPCGDNSRTFVDEIVVFTRKKAPLIGVKSWKHVKEIVKVSIVKEMMKVWDLDAVEDASEKILEIAQERYKCWRSSFSATYKAHSTDAERMKDKPKELDNVEWYYLIQYFGSERFQNISTKNSGNLKKQKTKHLTGSKPFSQIRFEQTNCANGEQPTDLQLWRSTHFKNGRWSNDESRDVYEKASMEVENIERGKDQPFLTAEEENAVFQLNYSKFLGTKSYKSHGRGYMAKYPTRSALLKQRAEAAAHAELYAQQERVQHQEEVRELKEQLANEVAARERDKEESKKQMDEIREEFRLALQQALSGKMIPSLVSNGPTAQDFITPQRIEAEALKTAEPQSELTTEKEVDASHTIKPKSTSTRNIFAKSNAASGPTNCISSDQLFRTRNQKKNQQRHVDSQNN